MNTNNIIGLGMEKIALDKVEFDKVKFDKVKFDKPFSNLKKGISKTPLTAKQKALLGLGIGGLAGAGYGAKKILDRKKDKNKTASINKIALNKAEQVQRDLYMKHKGIDVNKLNKNQIADLNKRVRSSVKSVTDEASKANATRPKKLPSGVNYEDKKIFGKKIPFAGKKKVVEYGKGNPTINTNRIEQQNKLNKALQRNTRKTNFKTGLPYASTGIGAGLGYALGKKIDNKKQNQDNNKNNKAGRILGTIGGAGLGYGSGALAKKVLKNKSLNKVLNKNASIENKQFYKETLKDCLFDLVK